MYAQRLRRLLRAPAGRWLPRRTVRMRLTALYGALFLGAGALLLTITYLLFAHNGSGTASVTVNSKNGQQRATVVFGAAPPTLPQSAGPQTFRGASGSAAPTAAPSTPSPERLRSQLQTVLDQQRSHELHQLLLWSGAALGIMALASIALGWVVAGRVLAPLRTMTARTRRISADNLDARLALSGPDDELKDLGDTIDGLLARLERAFDAQRRFVANASHELRTPLTLERAMIEVALADPEASVDSLRAVCARVLASGADQERLIEALLTLARGQRGLDRRERVDLADVAAAALQDAAPHTPIVSASLGAAPVRGDGRLVERLVGNLVDNAIRHNVRDGWVRITTATSGGRASLTVANSGPRIAPGQERELLEPFRRGAPERAGHGHGHGLGLSIAAAVASAHDAELTVRARREGGLDVEVSFAAAPAEAAADRPGLERTGARQR